MYTWWVDWEETIKPFTLVQNGLSLSDPFDFVKSCIFCKNISVDVIFCNTYVDKWRNSNLDNNEKDITDRVWHWTGFAITCNLKPLSNKWVKDISMQTHTTWGALSQWIQHRGGICPSRQCRRECKIFASGVNFSIFTHFLCFFLLKPLKLGDIDGVKFLV